MSESQRQGQSTVESPGRPWRVNELLPDLTRRLSRSATIALLLSPVGIILFAVMRLLIICNYHIATALAVASSGGYVNTLLGTVLPMVPVLLPYLALMLLFFNRVILGALAAVATLLISPTAVNKSVLLEFVRRHWRDVTSGWLSIPIGILAVIVTLLLLAQLTSFGLSRFSRSLATVSCILLVPVVLLLYPPPSGNSYYAHLIRQPWLPAEFITLSSGVSVTGYIISEDQDWVTVLTNENRQVYYYHSDQIAKRAVCQSEKTPAESPLISLTPSTAPSFEPPQCRSITVNSPTQTNTSRPSQVSAPQR